MAKRARVASKTALFEAAREWRAADVAAMARELPKLVGARDNSGRTALHVCARRQPRDAAERKRALATARALVAAGADVNAIHEIPDDGEIFPATALWHALVWGRNRPLGAYLLARGSDPNHCLFGLVWNDDLVSAKLVRRYGAELDEFGHGETPLIYAARHQRVRLAEWLLRQGADATLRDRDITSQPGTWLARQIERARANLPWCDGTAAGLAELEASRPEPVPETLIHGDLALDNVLVDADGAMSFIDWAGAGSGDPRHDIALALENEPEFKLTPAALDAFYAGYGSAPVDDRTCRWFNRLYNYF